jgi:hypothetical protein
MIKDLGEFGKQDVVINTTRVSYVHKLDRSNDEVRLLNEDTTLELRLVCDGALITFLFKDEERDTWQKCFEFFKQCLYENGDASQNH